MLSICYLCRLMMPMVEVQEVSVAWILALSPLSLSSWGICGYNLATCFSIFLLKTWLIFDALLVVSNLFVVSPTLLYYRSLHFASKDTWPPISRQLTMKALWSLDTGLKALFLTTVSIQVFKLRLQYFHQISLVWYL